MKRVVLAFLLALSLPASAAPRWAPPQDRLVDIRGTRMFVRIYPGGRDTILLEAGSGYGTDAWDDIAPQIRAATGATVISYDRAGMGRSDLPGAGYDVHDEIARTHDLLTRIGRDRGVILVGHSYGGYLIQLYANLYPGDVRGMVYIDANTVALIDAIGGPGPLAAASIKANDVAKPTKLQSARLRQARALSMTHDALRRYPPVCGIPVVVIAASRTPATLKPDVVTAVRAAHRGLADATRGRLEMAAQSGHFVMRDQPAIVVDAVRDVASRATHGAKTGVPGTACAALKR